MTNLLSLAAKRIEKKSDENHLLGRTMTGSPCVPKQHIVIAAIGRSGGSLLARLFDGHPRVVSYPFEPRFGRILSLGHPNASEDFSLPLTGTIKQVLDQHRRLKSFQDIITNRRPAKRTYLSFDENRFEKLISRNLPPNCSPATFRDLVSESFFKSNPMYFERWSQIKIVCWHTVLSHYWSDNYIKRDDSKVIFLVRHPLDVYNSLLKLKGEKVPLLIDFELLAWKDSVLRALDAIERYPDQAILVRYEDLVSNVDGEMSRLARFLNIEVDENLFSPTIFGQEWQGASSFDVAKEVSSETIGRYFRILSDADRMQANHLIGDLMAIMGYLDGGVFVRPMREMGPEELRQMTLSLGRDYYFSYIRNVRSMNKKSPASASGIAGGREIAEKVQRLFARRR